MALIENIEKKPVRKRGRRFKTCRRCGRDYITSSKYSKICDGCKKPHGKGFVKNTSEIW